jgi:hypothetical protein
MMSAYAVISSPTNICDNVIKGDDTSQWSPPDDHYIIIIDGLSVGIGWHYDPVTQIWVGPPTISAAFSPAPIFLGQETALLWSSTDAINVTLSTDPDAVFAPNGSKAYTPASIGKMTVIVTAVGVAGSISFPATTTVYGTQSELNSETVFL